MKYIFILGNNPSLSMAEILSKIDCQEYKYLGFSVFFINTKKEIDAKELIKELGGTIKIALVQKETRKGGDELLQAVGEILPQEHEGKFKFGFSYYGGVKVNSKRVAMETKRKLKEKSISCRWVTSKENTLSSVVVGQNKLDSKGLEVIVAPMGDKFVVAKTVAVQDYKSLSFRDYQRPARDDKSGMLPPKLAQIMINLALLKSEKNDILLDPFCGSGTVLMEAVLMGFQDLIGSDLSERAVADTRENTEWVKEKFNIKELKYSLYNIGATELVKEVELESIDAVVTEPYLGPQRGRIDIVKVKKELTGLYSRAIAEFLKVIKKEGRVVMIWPIIKTDNKQQGGNFINPDYHGFEIINPLPIDLQNKKDPSQSLRNTIIYGRQGQRVWREIVVMRKK